MPEARAAALFQLTQNRCAVRKPEVVLPPPPPSSSAPPQGLRPHLPLSYIQSQRLWHLVSVSVLSRIILSQAFDDLIIL